MKYTARMQNNPARYNSDACIIIVIIYCYVRASATDAHHRVSAVVCRLIGDSVGGARLREIVYRYIGTCIII